ncbi:MAG TPA: T9SS type A sorting domain-containing protein [Saprospiraceae bacterium]|nr:T9SS type A sorting domain-containing protein [Saprospiraceae bacterium]
MRLFLLSLSFSASILSAQPKLYIHFVSHNEPNDNLQLPLNYQKAKANVLQMANLINNANLKWNLQTCDGFVLGALKDEATTGSNIFELLNDAPFNDNIQIDPRSKNSGGRNIADLYHLLDSCGANPSTHLGGCIYYTTNPNIQPIDWEQYRNPVIGNIYGNSWQCSIITGAGSYPPHSNDLNDFGVFKPDTPNNFYHHNPDKNLWCLGTGCAPVLDSLSDAQAIIDLIQAQADSIQQGYWPSDRFYITRIMTNQREYGPLFFQKVKMVIDSLSIISPQHLQWATIGESFEAFQAWQEQTNLDHSMWRCGEVNTSAAKAPFSPAFAFWPNPAASQLQIQPADTEPHQVQIQNLLGQTVLEQSCQSGCTLDISRYPAGVYLLILDQKQVRKWVKDGY